MEIIKEEWTWVVFAIVEVRVMLRLGARGAYHMHRKLEWHMLVRPGVIVERNGGLEGFKIHEIQRVNQFFQETSYLGRFYVRLATDSAVTLDALFFV